MPSMKIPPVVQTTRAVKEYRQRYPDKAVVSSNSNDEWTVLMGAVPFQT